MNALSVQKLHKVYKGGMVALNSVDLDVEAGDFFALLGPNGAGKSTLIGIAASLVRKTSGNVSVCGYDTVSSAELARSCIGLVPQEFNFNTFEPIIEILVNSAGFHGIGRKEAKLRAEHYLRKLDLWGKHKGTPRELSGGMKRRLMIARALIHEPRLLILDEPTAGVDIEIRRSMWSFLTELNKESGTTIILTTHYLEEAEALCRNVAIIDKGSIIERGEVSRLLGQSKVESFVLDIADPPPDLSSLTNFKVAQVADRRIEIEVPNGCTMNDVFAELNHNHITVTSLRNKSNRLEEFFLRLMEQNGAVQSEDQQ